MMNGPMPTWGGGGGDRLGRGNIQHVLLYTHVCIGAHISRGTGQSALISLSEAYLIFSRRANQRIIQIHKVERWFKKGGSSVIQQIHTEHILRIRYYSRGKICFVYT